MSTIKSSAEHLTLNADGASKDIKFQANGVEKASISSSGAFTSTTIDATALTGNLPAISGASLTNLPAGGITEADQWRLTTQTAGDLAPVSANLERVDSDGLGHLGTGMSVSSGTWTFPSTGFWLVQFNAAFYTDSATSRFNRARIYTTTDGGDPYNQAAEASCWFDYVSPQSDASCMCQILFDVTNTSTHKVQFYTDVATSTTINWGDSTSNKLCMTFLKLGET
jgi:hypothetical protein